MLSRVLHHLGYRIEFISDLSKLAERVVEQEIPDVALVEVCLEERPETVEAVRRAADANPKVGFVATGTGLSPELTGDLRRAGFVHVLPKPYDLANLRGALRGAMGVLFVP
ncbi:MAG: hypothetical protein Kow0069_31190 [Promethearchaeota archaeon]